MPSDTHVPPEPEAADLLGQHLKRAQRRPSGCVAGRHVASPAPPAAASVPGRKTGVFLQSITTAKHRLAVTVNDAQSLPFVSLYNEFVSAVVRSRCQIRKCGSGSSVRKARGVRRHRQATRPLWYSCGLCRPGVRLPEGFGVFLLPGPSLSRIKNINLWNGKEELS